MKIEIYAYYVVYMYTLISFVVLFFFFFQAEDGIRDRNVTGVQTCALPISLSNAGAPYPLLLRDGHVISVRLEGVPLGLLPETQYDESVLDLAPGDVVVFASDGILESQNTAAEEFGLERLSAVLSAISPQDSARAIAERILAETDDHSGAGSAPHDDRTLVVLRVTEETGSDFSKLPIIY